MNNKFSIFNKLNRKQVFETDIAFSEDIKFMLCFDEYGSFFKIVNKEKKEFFPHHDYYSSPEREILKNLELIKQRNQDNLNWLGSAERIYLHENEHLLYSLIKSENIVDENFKPCRLTKDKGEFCLEVNTKNKQICGNFSLTINGKKNKNYKLISENCLLTDNKIIMIEPLGEFFQDIQEFKFTTDPKDLESYLSLTYSYFENFDLAYDDFIVKNNPERLETTSAVIFEQIDEDNSLHLKIQKTIKGYDSDLVDKYDLKKVASINDISREIMISVINYHKHQDCKNEIIKSLKKMQKGLKKDCDYFQDGDFIIIEKELAKLFIFENLTTFASKYQILGAEKLVKYKIRTVKPKLSLAVSQGIDYLEGDASVSIENEEFKIFDLINNFKKKSYLTLNDGTNALIDKNYLAKLERVFRKDKNKIKISFFDMPLVEELLEKKTADTVLNYSREIFSQFNNIKKSKEKIPKLKAELRKYQLDGFKWLSFLDKYNLGGCLADDMGLGKTLQTIALLSKIYPKETKPTLIVVPRTLLFNWESEIRKFNKSLTYYTYYQQNRDLELAISKNLILTTYALVRNDIQKLKDIGFRYVILDESQNIKNLSSQISKAVVLLKSKNRLALSGTPVENNLFELYSLFRFLNPAMFGSERDFNRLYQIPIIKENDKEVMKELKLKIYPFLLRRLKKDVLTELPEKVEQIHYVEMSKKQKELYEEKRRLYKTAIKDQIKNSGIKKAQFFIFQALNDLRQIASVPESQSSGTISSPKREYLLETIMESIANNHKVLIFANFLNAVDLISDELENKCINHLVMTGSSRNRQQLVEQFQNDKNIKAFVLTLKTGGTGLNLTAADQIFIYDPWWNIAAENQAIDRAHRIGQDKTVFSHKLITKDTIEEKILELQERKKELFENLIESESASFKSLSEQDIDYILA